MAEDDEEDELPINNRRSVPVTAPGIKREDALLGGPSDLP